MIADPTTVLTDEARALLEKFYLEHGIEAKSTDWEKIAKLNIQLGNAEGAFYAYGGDEDDTMELRALECMFLLEEGCDEPFKA